MIKEDEQPHTGLSQAALWWNMMLPACPHNGAADRPRCLVEVLSNNNSFSSYIYILFSKPDVKFCSQLLKRTALKRNLNFMRCLLVPWLVLTCMLIWKTSGLSVYFSLYAAYVLHTYFYCTFTFTYFKLSVSAFSKNSCFFKALW